MERAAVGVTGGTGVSFAERLLAFAARAGRAAAVDEKLADDLAFRAEAKRREADELERDARRAKGEAAQHLQDETELTEMAEQFARAERRRAASQTGDFALRSKSRGGGLTRDEQHKVDRLLGRFPNAGRPQIVAETGISEWRVRCYLAERRESLTGGTLEDGSFANEVAGGGQRFAGVHSEGTRHQPSPAA
jgi:hypothetical protein